MGGKPYEKRINKTTGNIMARVTVGYRGDKQLRVSKTFPKGTGDEVIRRWALGAKASSQGAEVIPFDALLDEWLDHKRPQVALKTFRIYRLSCNAYLRGAFGDAASVTPEDVQRLIRDHGHLSPRSLELIRTYARMVFAYAVERGYLAESPVTKAVVVPRRRRKRPIRVLTVAQFDKLSAALDTPSERDVALRTLLLTGLRVSELLALQPHHLAENALTVEQGIESRYGRRIPTPPKSDHAYRTIAVPRALAERLLALPARPFVFGVGYTCLRDALGRVCQAQGLPALTLHGLRHSHCVYLLAKGVPILAVSKRLGHHSPAFTLERYGHLIPEMNAGIEDILGRAA